MTTALNKVMLLGNLGADPVIRSTQKGEKVASFRIATSDRWKDQDGAQQERTEWHNIVIFGRAAEIAERYLSKGSRVLVEGQLRHRKWQDQSSGNERYITEVVISPFIGQLHLIDTRASSAAKTGGGMGGGAMTGEGEAMGDGGGDGPKPSSDDDIPF